VMTTETVRFAAAGSHFEQHSSLDGLTVPGEGLQREEVTSSPLGKRFGRYRAHDRLPVDGRKEADRMKAAVPGLQWRKRNHAGIATPGSRRPLRSLKGRRERSDTPRLSVPHASGQVVAPWTGSVTFADWLRVGRD